MLLLGNKLNYDILKHTNNVYDSKCFKLPINTYE